MSLSTLFRLLVIGDLAIGMLAVAVDFIPGVVTPAMAAAYESTVSVGQLHPQAVIGAVAGIGYIAAFIGLLAFAWWAPPLALLVTAVRLLLTPWLGPVLKSGWGETLAALSAMSWGGAIVLAYFSPLRARFARAS